RADFSPEWTFKKDKILSAAAAELTACDRLDNVPVLLDAIMDPISRDAALVLYCEALVRSCREQDADSTLGQIGSAAERIRTCWLSSSQRHRVGTLFRR